MARKIAVIHKESVQTYVKKSVAALLVRRLMAVWVKENFSIRRLPICSHIPNQSTLKSTPIKKVYIPQRLPSHKSPGTRAIGPVVEQGAATRARIIVANMIAAGR